MAKKKTFEQSMSRLEEIVAALEKGDAPLEESLALFQEGTRLISACGKALDQAQQQLSVRCRRAQPIGGGKAEHDLQGVGQL